MRPPIRTDLTQQDVRDRFHYDPISGHFYRTGKTEIAGTINNNGYRLLSVHHRKYRSHRIAWLYMTGEWPKGEIDHINGVRDDNRWINLRDVPMLFNQQNRRTAMKTNKLGIQGVKHNVKSDKFVANISIGKRNIFIGSFDRPKEAGAAYLEAKRVLHEGFTA